jgi:hypothetical protein
MKKVIKLTESDLTRIVKRVIEEQGVRNPSTENERLKAERDRLKKELAKLEAQIASFPKEGGKRVHDKMVMDCLKKAGFKVGNTSGKYDLYMFKETQSSIGSVSYIVTSQQNPTIFATNTVTNGKTTSSRSFQIGTSTNCDEIVRNSTM